MRAVGDTAEVERLEREKQALTARIEALRPTNRDAPRPNPKISEECLKNPLAAACR